MAPNQPRPRTPRFSGFARNRSPTPNRFARNRSPNVNRSRVPSPQPVGPRTPSPQPGSRGAGGGLYRVYVQEGDSRMRFGARTINRFVQLCERPTYGVADSYIRNVLKPAEKNRQFVMVVLKVPDKTVVGFIKGSLYTALVGVHVARIAVLDVVCGDTGERGIGQVLLKEMETYAATRLGAGLMLLDAVTEPSVIRSYTRAGFKRGMGMRTPDTIRQAQIAYHKAILSSRKFANATDEWHNAMQQEYYPRNSLDQTVVMFKLVPAVRKREMNKRPVHWGKALPGARKKSGVFRGNNTVALGTYTRNANGFLRERR